MLPRRSPFFEVPRGKRRRKPSPAGCRIIKEKLGGRLWDMDTWGVIAFTIFFPLALAAAVLRRRTTRRLPPGPPAIPLLGSLVFLRSKARDFESVLGNIWSKYGPVVRIHLGFLPFVFVADRDLAHKMLVQHGAVFADRPSTTFLEIFTSDHTMISTAAYGPLWRLLRRNLAVEMLNPSRLKQCAGSREWVLGILFDELQAQAKSQNGVVIVREAFRYAIFCLLVFLCFGQKMEEAAVREIEGARRDLALFFQTARVFAMAPKLARFLFWGRWKRLLQLQQKQREIFLPLIRSRRQQKESRVLPLEKNSRFSYLDSLLDLELPEDNGRKLGDEEIMFLCTEFLDAGSETTSSALEWIMANVVKNPGLQEKLAQEVGESTMEEDLQTKPYLKAVVLEGLRRHPPAHFLLTHATTEEIVMGGYTIQKGASINYGVAKMNLDEEIWVNPLEFKPERFLSGGEGEGVDITCSKKIQMITFGAGRRICPGMGLALLHLEYFVANLVGKYRWEKPVGGEIDLEEETEFMTLMKNPLSARISPRFKR